MKTSENSGAVRIFSYGGVLSAEHDRAELVRGRRAADTTYWIGFTYAISPAGVCRFDYPIRRATGRV